MELCDIFVLKKKYVREENENIMDKFHLAEALSRPFITIFHCENRKCTK